MFNVGVVVGRFQVDSLSDAHKAIIDFAAENNDRVIILIGVPAVQGSTRNPLDYQTRYNMVRQYVKDFGRDDSVIIMPVHDRECDREWEKQTDGLIAMVYPDASKVTLYCGRDGFEKHYQGKYTVVNIENDIPQTGCCGTDRRAELGAKTGSSIAFRHGIIYSTQHSWPHVKMAVDIIYWRPPAVTGAHGSSGTNKNHQVLVGRKPHETGWRLPGGFVDPVDPSLEMAARRELMEETGMVAEHEMKYVTSRPCDDWRYRGLPNESLYTACFSTMHMAGIPKANDDLSEVKWIDYEDAYHDLIGGHNRMFNEFMNQQGAKEAREL